MLFSQLFLFTNDNRHGHPLQILWQLRLVLVFVEAFIQTYFLLRSGALLIDHRIVNGPSLVNIHVTVPCLDKVVLACRPIGKELVRVTSLITYTAASVDCRNRVIFTHSQVLLQVVIVIVGIIVSRAVVNVCTGALLTLTEVSQQLSMDLAHPDGFKVG